MRALSLALVLFSGVALAQGYPPVPPPPVIPAPTATDHVGQDVQASSYTASAPADSCGLTLLPGANMCMANSPSTSRFRWDTTAARFILEGSLTLSGGKALKLEAAALGSCDVGSEGDVRRGADGKQYECASGVWYQVWTEADGTLARSDKDLYVNSLIVANMDPTGAAGKYSLISNVDSCIRLGPGSNVEFCGLGNTITFTGSTIQATAHFAQPACKANEDCNWYTDTGKWFSVRPQASLTGCAVGNEGGLRPYSTDHSFRYCDGTTVQKLAFIFSNGATLDFASIAAGATATLDIALSGTTTTDGVACNPTGGAIEAGLSFYATIATNGQASVILQNNTGGPIDPASHDWRCTTTR